MTTPLQPSEIFPAGSADITQRFVMLASGIRVRVVESGPIDGPCVLFLPGWGATAYMFRHAFDELARRGLRVIALDPRGFGLSDRPTARGAYSLDAYIADVIAAMDALHITRAVLAGQSMGGGVALRFALRHPERVARLILINPIGLTRLRFLTLLRAMPQRATLLVGRWAIPRVLVRLVLEHLAYGDPSKVTERDIDEYWSPTQLPNYVYAARAALSEFDWSPLTDAEAGSLAVPTLVILGSQDRLVPNDEPSAKRLRGAEVHRLAGGHCVHEELSGASYRLIAEFVAR